MLTNTSNMGLKASMANLQTIGNNIANANTVGFKESNVRFSDVYASNLASGTEIGIGVRVSGVDQNFSSGSTELTGRTLDISIANDAFFVAKDSDNGLVTYTRAGQFTQDKEGFIRAPSGSVIQGYTYNDGILTANTADIKIPSEPLLAKPTANVNAEVNLNSASDIISVPFDSADPSSYSFRIDTVLYDSLGNPGNLSAFFSKSADNQWSVNVENDGTSLGSGVANFADNGLLSSTTGLDSLVWNPGSGATAPQNFALNLTGSTQLSDDSQATTITQDGYASGRVTSFDVSSDGVFAAHYSNGESRNISKIALATFNSPQGLASVGGMSWKETNDSGDALINSANSDGAIRSGSLESSNVDITQQLVMLMSAQRDFQANAQVIRASDELNQTIINL